MMGLGVASLRERFDAVDFGVLGALTVALPAANNGAASALVSLVVLAIALVFFDWLLEAADLGDTGAGLLFGSVVAGLGAVVVGSGGSIPVGAGIVAIGCWLVLDTIYESRHGDPAVGESAGEEDEDLTDGELHGLMGHSQRVVEELREASRPLTADELRTRTGLTADELEDVFELALENGIVERVGNGYAVDERELGGVAFVRGLVRTVGGRVLRPFRLFRPSR